MAQPWNDMTSAPRNRQIRVLDGHLGLITAEWRNDGSWGPGYYDVNAPEGFSESSLDPKGWVEIS